MVALSTWQVFDNSFFLLDKSGGRSEIYISLDQAHSQSEYNRLLDFENRDLQIREKKHTCFSLFKQVLSQQPSWGESEAFRDFQDYLTKKLEEEFARNADPDLSISQKDRIELDLIQKVLQDLKAHGPDSIHIKGILGD